MCKDIYFKILVMQGVFTDNFIENPIIAHGSGVIIKILEDFLVFDEI